MAPMSDPQGKPEDFGVLVGWSHARTSHGIRLKVQSACARRQKPHDIATHNYLMTRNQALILAKYLLDVTGQSLPPRPAGGRIRRIFRRLTGG